jgi:hypothetical protein
MKIGDLSVGTSSRQVSTGSYYIFCSGSEVDAQRPTPNCMSESYVEIVYIGKYLHEPLDQSEPV